MSVRRVVAWAAKELRELRWLSAAFAAVAAGAGAGGAFLRAELAPPEIVATSGLVAVMAVLALLTGQRQSLELRSGTLRHLLSLPLEPGEIVAGKVLAFVAAVALPAVVGAGSLAVTASRLGESAPAPGMVVATAARLVLLSLVIWSLELTADSWPRTGLAVTLAVIAVYAGALALVPGLSRVGNVLRLVPVGGGDAAVVGAVGAAVFLAGVCLTWTVVGLGCRPVE